MHMDDYCSRRAILRPKAAAESQSVRAFVPQAEDWVFESQARQT